MASRHAYEAMQVVSAALVSTDKLHGAMTVDVGLGAALAAADVLATMDMSREEAKRLVTKAVDIIYSFREQVVEPAAEAAAKLGEALASGDAEKIGEAVKGLMAAQEKVGEALRKPMVKHDTKGLEEAARRADALADEIVAKLAKDEEGKA